MAPVHWRYKIIEELGRGAASAVYRALDLASGAEVALKVAGAGQEASLRAEFRRLHRLNHPNLVRAFDLSQSGGKAWLSLELLEEPLPAPGAAASDPERIMGIWAGLASALGHLHAGGLAHGDVKPENIRLSDGAAKLLDLGLAGSLRRAAGDGFQGTPAYAAPEALEHGEATPAGDVYGLGLTVWELLGGELPEPGQKLDPAEGWLRDMPAALPPPAAELLRSSLRYRPLDRIRDGAQLSWAMAEAGLSSGPGFGRKLPLCGRWRELRRAMAVLEHTGARLEVRARAGTGGTRFLEELKFLLQSEGREALLTGDLSSAGAAPGECVLLADKGTDPGDWTGRTTAVLSGVWPGAGGDAHELGDLGAADYRAMLGRLLPGAFQRDLDGLARWLGDQAGGHVRTAEALVGELMASRLVSWERIHWRFDWQGILSVEPGRAAEDVWLPKWESAGREGRERLKRLALAGSAEAGAPVDSSLAEWVRQSDGTTRLVGEAARGFVIDKCSPEECRMSCSAAAGSTRSRTLLSVCRRAGDPAAWLENCRALRLGAEAEGDDEAALHCSLLACDSGFLSGDELSLEVVGSAMLCRRLARYRLGLDLLERHRGALGMGWQAAKASMVLLIASGQAGQVEAMARQGMERFGAGTRESIEAGLFLGTALGMAGDRAQAEETIRAYELEARASGYADLELQARERLASLAYRAGDWAAVVEQARSGMDLAGGEPGDGFLVMMLGSGLAQTGRPEEAARVMEDFLRSGAARTPYPELGGIHSCLGMAYIKLEEWDMALERLGESEYYLWQSGTLGAMASSAANAAVVLGAMGNHSASRRKSLEAYRAFIEAGDRANASVCLSNAASRQAALGEPERARRAMGRALELASGPECGQARALIHKHMGLLEYEQGRFREALGSIDRSIGQAGELGIPPPFEAALFGSLALMGMGDLGSAGDRLKLASGLAVNRCQRVWVKYAKELMMAQQASGDEPRVGEAMEEMRELGRPREAALMALAAAEAPAGPAAAEPWDLLGRLVEAEAEFSRLGDGALAGRAREAIVETAKVLAAGHGLAGGRAMLEAFYQLAFLLGSGAGPERVGREAVEQAVRLSGAERGGLFLMDASGRPALLSGVNLDPETERDAADFSAQAISLAAREAAEVLSNDAQAEDQFRSRRSVQRNAIRSLACLPVRFREGGSGALYLDSRLRPGVFSAGRLRFLRALADLFGSVVEASRIMEELRAGQGREPALERIIGESDAMQELKERIRRAAPSGVNVLIEGETGTGKELAARAIHELSGRRDKAFVALDCGTLPETLLESELFGCAKGAFTGAHADKPGLFEAADGGTLFLDEITSASQAVQARLLRVVEEGEIRRVGETRARRVDVRLICAANRNMEFEVSEGRFKQDLYFRINGFRITVPPLRDRAGDILELAEHFRRRWQKAHGRRGLSFTTGAKRAMAAYPWPGNIRELESAVQKAVIMASGDAITEEGLELPPVVWQAQPQEDRRKRGVTRRMLTAAYKGSKHDTAATARKLGISQRQVQRLLKKHRMAT